MKKLTNNRRMITDWRYAKKIYSVSGVAGIVLLLIALLPLPKELALIIALLAIFIVCMGLIWLSLFYRCPHCDMQLPVKYELPSRCPECSMELNEK